MPKQQPWAYLQQVQYFDPVKATIVLYKKLNILKLDKAVIMMIIICKTVSILLLGLKKKDYQIKKLTKEHHSIIFLENKFYFLKLDSVNYRILKKGDWDLPLL